VIDSTIEALGQSTSADGAPPIKLATTSDAMSIDTIHPILSLNLLSAASP
jgi:hypothetical protein